MTDTYDARYGRTTGGTVNVVTKNGTKLFTVSWLRTTKTAVCSTPIRPRTSLSRTAERSSRWRINSGGPLAVPSSRTRCGSFSALKVTASRFKQTVTANVPPAYLRPATATARSILAWSKPWIRLSRAAGNKPTLTFFMVSRCTSQATARIRAIQTTRSARPRFPPAVRQARAATATNLIQNVFPFTGGTNNGALIPSARINNTANPHVEGRLYSAAERRRRRELHWRIRRAVELFRSFSGLLPLQPAHDSASTTTRSDKTKWYSFFEWQTGHEARSNNGLHWNRGQRQLFRAR